jgi:hypothetical protein
MIKCEFWNQRKAVPITRRKPSPDKPLVAGVYPARVLSVVDVPRIQTHKEHPIPWSGSGPRKVSKARYEKDPKSRWTFLITSGSNTTVTVSVQTSQKLGERIQSAHWKMKPLRWVEAILDRPLGDDEFEWDDIAGCWCNVTLTTDRGRNKIKDVTPRDWDVV